MIEKTILSKSVNSTVVLSLVFVGRNSTCTVAKATDFIIALIDIAPYFKEGFKHSCSH